MSLARRLTGAAAVVALFLVAFGCGWLVGRFGIGLPAVSEGELNELERDFAARMQNVSLVGHFTIAGRENQPDRSDRYDISSVEKISDDRWRFNTRVRYGDVDTTLPIVVPLAWAGDTPMVNITDYTIPTLGTFTARVFFYGDRYAGSWQHGDVGGLMYGIIEQGGAP